MDVNELIARTEIIDVLHRYAHGVDRSDWPLVRRCYHPDAYDDHGLYAGGVDGLMVFFQEVASVLISTTHQLSNFLVDIDGDSARCETVCLGWYTRLGRSGGEHSIAQGLRYLDHFERRDGCWAIARRTVVLDWEKVFEQGNAAPIAASWARGARGDADPSHGHLWRGQGG